MKWTPTLEQGIHPQHEASFTAPTLVVCGREDLPSFIEATNLLSKEIEKAKMLWLEPACYASILEQPASFMTALLPFLNR
jgi:pimeloyl-ACP methyl ester carboxylesterase